MARVHLFSPTPHHEKRRRISTAPVTDDTIATSNNVGNNTINNNDLKRQAQINELNRLAQLNQGPPPTLSDDTHTLDITAVPSSSTAHTTAITTPTTISEQTQHDTIVKEEHSQNSANGRSGTALTAAFLQNASNDMDLVNAFAAALSGKPETLQLIWDKVRRGSMGDDNGQRQGDDDKQYKEQHPTTNSEDTVDQEAAATALQLLGLASSSSSSTTTATDKRPSVDNDRTKATSTTATNESHTSVPTEISNDDDAANVTAAAAAAILRQALAQQQQQQRPPSDNNNNNNDSLTANMLMTNYPGITSPGSGNVEGLEIQDEIMQDYKRGTWTREEDELLLMGIKKFGYGRWKEIANTIPGRKGKQLKQRWDNTLASKYVDTELLQNKLRYDEQLTKLQQHLEGLLSTTTNLPTAPATAPTMTSHSAMATHETTPNNNTMVKSPNTNTAAIPRVEQADWTEIAHKITEKVREGDQEGIEALLSQALLGTDHLLETTPSASSPVKIEEVEEQHHTNTPNTTTTTTLPTTSTTTNDSAKAHTSQHQPSASDLAASFLGNVDFSRPNAPTTTIANAPGSSPPSISTTITSAAPPQSSSSSSSSSTTPAVLNYADAAALSLYQQLNQHHHTTNVNDSNNNHNHNPLAIIHALANNQYFLSNLFANVENGGSDNANAALAAAAAAAAAAMAQASSGSGTNTGNTATTDVSSLLASTMRSQLHLANSNNHHTTTTPGVPRTPTTTNNHRMTGTPAASPGPNTTTTTSTTTPTTAGSTSSTGGGVTGTSQHKRRRSDPALANTQSEAMSIYASSSPITTMVNNHPHTVYPCLFPNCGKAFARLYNLKSHSRTHTDDRPFNCQLCNTAFSRNHDLKRHLKTHVGEKPYKCGGCQKTFSRLDALKRHKSNTRNQAVCLNN